MRLALEAYMDSLRANGRTAFMPFITAGHPSLKSTGEIAAMLRDAGADCLELGIPFSDPVADGPVIQASSQAALAGGATFAGSLRAIEKAARTGLKVIPMSYANPILAHGAGGTSRAGLACLSPASLAQRAGGAGIASKAGAAGRGVADATHGLGRAARQLADAGAQGLIVPDLPLEESECWSLTLADAGIALVLFAAPTTGHDRLQAIGRAARGFVYYVSLTGVTGERSKLPPGLARQLDTVRRITAKPVCVGFGVSTPAQAGAVAAHADGVIVGSALVRRLAEWESGTAKRREIIRYAGKMAEAVHAK